MLDSLGTTTRSADNYHARSAIVIGYDASLSVSTRLLSGDQRALLGEQLALPIEPLQERRSIALHFRAPWIQGSETKVRFRQRERIELLP